MKIIINKLVNRVVSPFVTMSPLLNPQYCLCGGDKSHPEDDEYNGGTSYDGW